MGKLTLTHIGNDDFDRPVYQNDDGKLFVDTDPRSFVEPNLCTKLNNDFYGEPDTPIYYIKKYEDAEIIFVPERVVWEKSCAERSEQNDKYIGDEKLLSEEEWQKFGLTQDDVLLCYAAEEEYGDEDEIARLSITLFEKDGAFYAEEMAVWFNKETQTVRYALDEEKAMQKIKAFSEDYDIYESQFSHDRNAHYEISLSVTEKGWGYIPDEYRKRILPKEKKKNAFERD